MVFSIGAGCLGTPRKSRWWVCVPAKFLSKLPLERKYWSLLLTELLFPKSRWDGGALRSSRLGRHSCDSSSALVRSYVTARLCPLVVKPWPAPKVSVLELGPPLSSKLFSFHFWVFAPRCCENLFCNQGFNSHVEGITIRGFERNVSLGLWEIVLCTPKWERC